MLWMAPSARASQLVDVFPIPGGHVASPSTQLTFRGIPIAKLGKITVTGSASGVHTGTFEADSDGNGGSFLPAKPFAAGETVTVKTSDDIDGSGTYSFTVASPAGGILVGALNSAPRVPRDISHFYSAPQMVPARVTVTHLPHGAQSGDLFVAPQQGPVQNGVELLGPYGGLIWFKTLPKHDVATDFREQTYDGNPVLTWWQGTINGGVGTGQDEIYNNHYQWVATVKAGNGIQADLHEFYLTPENTALITAYYPVYWNTAGVKNGSSHDLVLDAVAQEIDIKTGLVMWQWDSLDHVPVTDSYQFAPPVAGHPWDYFHINAISQAPDGTFTISARNTWAVYNVNPSTAAVNWTLGGKSSTFKMGHDTPFMFQHDAVMRANDVMTIFDDGAGPPIVHKRSRGLVLKLDMANHTATMTLQDEHNPGLLANYEGSVQPMANGDNFVGWGQQPFMTEFNSRGRPVFDARFVGDNSSYRAYRYPWTGLPVTEPSAAERIAGGHAIAYASWNGATTVASWQILGGSSPTSLSVVETHAKNAWETDIPLAHSEAYVETRALDSKGHVLGTSKPVKLGSSG